MTDTDEIRAIVGESLAQREAAIAEGEKRLRDLMGFIKATLIDADRANTWHFIESRIGRQTNIEQEVLARTRQKPSTDWTKL